MGVNLKPLIALSPLTPTLSHRGRGSMGLLNQSVQVFLEAFSSRPETPSLRTSSFFTSSGETPA